VSDGVATSEKNERFRIITFREQNPKNLFFKRFGEEFEENLSLKGSPQENF